MKPRPRVSGKFIVSAVISILVVTCLCFGMYFAFSGIQPSSTKQENSPTESSQTSGVFDQQEQNSQKEEKNPENQNPTEELPEGEKTEDEESAKTETPKSDNAITPDAQQQVQQQVMSAQKIWDYLRGAMGESLITNLSLSPANMQSLYGIDPAICEEVIFQKAGTVVTPEEYLIVKASSANLSIVEQACHQRQTTLAEQWAKYGKETVQMINDYQIVRAGNFLFFGISPKVNQLAGIFQGLMMQV